jgi:hypothetical protein
VIKREEQGKVVRCQGTKHHWGLPCGNRVEADGNGVALCYAHRGQYGMVLNWIDRLEGR